MRLIAETIAFAFGLAGAVALTLAIHLAVNG